MNNPQLQWARLQTAIILGYVFIILALTWCGCGSKGDPNSDTFLVYKENVPDKFVDANLQPFLDNYMAEAHRRGIVSNGYLDRIQRVEFGSVIEQGYLGVCAVSSEQNPANKKEIREMRFVVIQPGLPPCLASWTIVHEFTHCIYNLDHSSHPGQIMAPTEVTDEQYCRAVWNDRLDSLFDAIKQYWK
jgi:hypothetical protein